MTSRGIGETDVAQRRARSEEVRQRPFVITCIGYGNVPMRPIALIYLATQKLAPAVPFVSLVRYFHTCAALLCFDAFS